MCPDGLQRPAPPIGYGSSRLYAKNGSLVQYTDLAAQPLHRKMAVNVARGVFSLQTVTCLVLLLGGSVTGESSNVQEITTENFQSVLEGEWMLEL